MTMNLVFASCFAFFACGHAYHHEWSWLGFDVIFIIGNLMTVWHSKALEM